MPDQEKKCEKCQRIFTKESDFMSYTTQWRVCAEGNLWFNCSCESSLMIPKGKFSWYSPDKFMNEEVKGVFNRIANTKDFPHIPTVIMKIQQKVQNEDVLPKELASYVKQDPFLLAEILRIAGNMQNLKAKDRVKAKSLEHAIVYVGRKTLSDLVVVASISAFKTQTKIFNLHKMWEGSLLCATIAEYLVQKLNPALRSDEVYLAACLCNIGKVVSALCYPKETDEIWEAVKAEKISWSEVESKYDIDHSILGEIGASIWGLPNFVGQACRQHHFLPEHKKAATNSMTMQEIVAFANCLVPWFDKEITYNYDSKIDIFKKKFAISDSLLNDIVDHFKKKVR